MQTHVMGSVNSWEPSCPEAQRRTLTDSLQSCTCSAAPPPSHPTPPRAPLQFLLHSKYVHHPGALHSPGWLLEPWSLPAWLAHLQSDSRTSQQLPTAQPTVPDPLHTFKLCLAPTSPGISLFPSLFCVSVTQKGSTRMQGLFLCLPKYPVFPTATSMASSRRFSINT